jgi:HEAT repeat protein
MKDFIENLLKQYGDNKLAIAICGTLIGFFLTKLLPFLWNSLRSFVLWTGKIIGGRLSYHAFLKRYLNWVVTENRELNLTGIVTTDDAKKPTLEQVYVSLSIESKKWDHDVSKRHTASHLYNSRFFAPELVWGSPLWYPGNDTQDEGMQLKSVLRKYTKIAVLGVPGAGKTTLLQYIALTYARERASDPRLKNSGILKNRLGTKKWQLPVFIRLSSIASLLSNYDNKDKDPSILDIIHRILPPDLQSNNSATKFFIYYLKKGRCILLLDGLDEIPTDKEFHAVVKAINSLCINYPGNQFVITSRIAGWRSGINTDFETFYVNDLTDSQINTFIDTWYAAVEKNTVIGRLQDEGVTDRNARERRASRQSEDLKATLKNNIGIRHLANNPMLLSIIAVVHRRLATLPKERSKLYAQCTTILLEQWDISRGIRKDDTRLKLEQKEAIMRRLAFAFHTGEIGDKGGGRQASRHDVQRIIAEILPNLGRTAEDAAYLLNVLIERSGLIIERQRDILSFAHHTFQEYFSAHYLASTEPVKNRNFLLQKENLLSDWWREVILLYAGLLSDSSDFIRMIYKIPQDDLCQQKLRLAVECLGESVKINKVEIRNKLIQEVLNIRSKNIIRQYDNNLPPETIDYLLRWTKSLRWYTNAAKSKIKDCTNSDQLKPLQHQIQFGLLHPQSIVRQAAIESLSVFPPTSLQPQLFDMAIEMLTDEDKNVRRSALQVIPAIGNIDQFEKTIMHLLVSIRERNTEITTDCIHALVALKGRFTARALHLSKIIEMFKNSNQKIAENAKQIFPLFLQHTNEADIKKIILNIPEINSSNYLGAVCTLKNLSPEITNHILHKIIDTLTSPYKTAIRKEILDAISESNNSLIENSKIINTLFSIIATTSLSPESEEKTIQILTKSNSKIIEPRIRELLNSTERTNIIIALKIIRKIKIPQSLNDVAARLISFLDSKDTELLEEAAQAMIILEKHPLREAAMQKLLKLTKSKSVQVRLASIFAICFLNRAGQKEEYNKAIILSLNDKSMTVRMAAIKGIRDISDRRMLPTIIDILLSLLIKHINSINLIKPRQVRQSLWHDYRNGLDIMYTIAYLGSLVRSEKVFNILYDKYLDYYRLDKKIYELGLQFEHQLNIEQENFVSDHLNGVVVLNQHPLIIIGEKMPSIFLTARLMKALSSDSEESKECALFVINELNEKFDISKFEPLIISCLDDRNKTIRQAAIKVAASIYTVTNSPHITEAIINRLSDDNTDIQDTAWNILQSPHKVVAANSFN